MACVRRVRHLEPGPLDQRGTLSLLLYLYGLLVVGGGGDEEAEEGAAGSQLNPDLSLSVCQEGGRSLLQLVIE